MCKTFFDISFCNNSLYLIIFLFINLEHYSIQLYEYFRFNKFLSVNFLSIHYICVYSGYGSTNLEMGRKESI